MTLTTSKDEQLYNEITAHPAKKYKVTLENGVNENTDLFQEGLIDSFGFVELVAYLEKTYSIHFQESEFTSNGLNTVANIVATVKRKTAS